MHHGLWQRSDSHFFGALAILRVYEVEFQSGKCIIYQFINPLVI